MKKKLIITLIIEVVLILIILGLGYYSYSHNSPKIINTEFTYELGEAIDINEEDIIETNIEVTIDKLDSEDVGAHLINLSYLYWKKEYVVPLTINIVDTTPPVFSKTQDEFEVEEGSKPIEFEKHFEAEDLAEITYKYNIDNIDYSTPGIYEASVSATDTSLNITNYPFRVTVKEVKKIEPTSNEVQITYVQGLIVVNKKHPLPKDYNPGEDPTALKALKDLIAEAQSNDLAISNSYSGFRSYDYQAKLYQNYVNRDGQANADRYSARAGYSEHQTGLAFDLCSTSGALLQTDKECNWVKENAYRFGFIVRYLEEKEDVTGYMYEPWHLRYVGDLAEDIYNSGLTLEEYLGVAGGRSY